MTDEQDVKRGRLAEDVLANEAYTDSHDQIEQEIYRKWQESRNPDDREQLHRLLMALRLVKSALESTMRSGKLAAAELERKANLAQRVGRALKPSWRA